MDLLVAALAPVRLGRCRPGQFGRTRIDALVLSRAFERVGALAEDALDPFIEEQARAIDEFVDHARREVVGRGVARRVLGEIRVRSGSGSMGLAARSYEGSLRQ